MRENYLNGYTVELNTSITSTSATSIDVTAAAANDGGFRILIDAELLLVTGGGTTTTWTVTRGIEGSTAATHSGGTTIFVVISAGSLDQVRSDISLVGPTSGLPSSGMKAGDQYRANDSPYEYVYDGSQWQAFSFDGLNVVPPVLSNFSWVNQGSATATQVGGMISVSAPPVSGDQYRSLVKSIPSSPCTITILMHYILAFYSFSQLGIVLRDSSSGKMITNAIVIQPSTDSQLTAAKLDNNTSFDSAYTTFHVPCTGKVGLRFRIDAGGTRYFGYSIDGLQWWEYFNVGNTDFITPDQVGIYVDTNNTTAPVDLDLISYQETQP